LREGYISTEGKQRNAIFDSASGPSEELRSEPDRESLNVEASALSGEKVTELVDEDRASE